MFLTKDGYQQEIEWALRKMLEVYGVSSFDSLKGELKIKNRYFVYRFLNENNVIIYVGRTQNLQQRFYSTLSSQ